MNCQEFRHRWNKLHDSANLSQLETNEKEELHSDAHIALCVSCMDWLEANFDSDEEVRFMREFPQPSAQLEDRIMKAIYETAGHGAQSLQPSKTSQTSQTSQTLVPPLSAAGQAVSKENVSRRFPRRWQSFAWVGAAGLLLAVGVLSWRGMTSSDMGNMASSGAPAATQKAASEAESGVTSQPSPAPSANAPEQQQTLVAEATTPKLPSSNANGAASSGVNNTKSSDSGVKNNQVVLPPAAPDTAPLVAENTNPAAKMENSAAASAQQRPLMARDKKSPAAVPAPSAKQAAANAVAKADAAPTEEKVAIAEEPVFDKTQAADQENQVTAIAAAPTNGSMSDQHAITAGPPAPENSAAALVQPITVSTFTDVPTAVQASNLPVPSAAKPPNGFALHSVSLKYESETSKRVTDVTTMYTNNTGWIKIEVSPNENGKRTLSVPGTFSERQLFTIDNEQAIGVTYQHQGDTAASTETPVQHAVYFNTTKQNQSLYVVITGTGAPLQELTELAKQLVWSK